MRITAGSSNLAVFRLLPNVTRYVDDLSKKTDMAVNGLQLSVPTDAFANKEPGTIAAAFLNPKGDLRTMPGEFDGRDLKGTNVSLETLGAVNIQVSDNRGGELQPKKALSILFPYQGKGKEKETIPLWSFDPKLGEWKQEGTGTIVRKGSSKFVQADIPHLSWWNLDQPISNKTSIWVKSFVTEKGEALFTPMISGLGRDYNGLSFPYDAYPKFGDGPVLAGSCIDVKLGSKIRLTGAFYGASGVYESTQEMKVPAKSSSCRTNPAEGIVIEKLEMKRIASSCVRGRAAFKQAAIPEI